MGVKVRRYLTGEPGGDYFLVTKQDKEKILRNYSFCRKYKETLKNESKEFEFKGIMVVISSVKIADGFIPGHVIFTYDSQGFVPYQRFISLM